MSDAALYDPSPILYFSPELVVELALGADHPHEVAERYGVSEVEYEHLITLPWFEEMVARKRAEFHDNGVMFQAKAAMMGEALLTRLFQQSMGGQLTPPIMIEVSKQLVDIGRLKPQPINTRPDGNGAVPFAINIQINGADMAAPAYKPVIEAAPAAPPTLTLAPVETTPEPSLPPKPPYISGLKTPNFDRDVRPTRSSLAGTPAAQAAVTAPAPSQPSSSPTPQVGLGLPPGSPVR